MRSKGAGLDVRVFRSLSERVRRRFGSDREARVIRSSGLFDPAYYLRMYQDVAASGADPLAHFLRHGASEGRNPSPYFETAYYVRQRKEALERSRDNPLVDFLETGSSTLASPNPFFDSASYAKRNHVLLPAGVIPLLHYLGGGWREGMNPSEAFQAREYLNANPDVRDAGVEPLGHFLEFGLLERRGERPGGGVVIPARVQACRPAPKTASRNGPESIHARFCTELPSARTALGIFEGAWKSRVPGQLGIGEQDRFADNRVEWFMGAAGLKSLEGLRILELGPFEAYNTYHFCRFGATDVTAVEGNTVNFLKCLVVKEVLGFGAKFLCGDFIEFLKASERPYDVVWASGVLYHQTKPIELLQQAMRNGRYVFVWTHYYDDRILGTHHAPEFDGTKNQKACVGGTCIDLHYRSYLIEDYENSIPLYYESGFRPHAYWMKKEDILRVFELAGFQLQVMGELELDKLPVIAFLATRGDSRG